LNVDSFEKLYKTYQPSLVNFANFYLKNEQEAIDIVQELFLNIWEKKDFLKEVEYPKAYLMAAIKNKCINKMMRNKLPHKSLETLPDIFVSSDDFIKDLEAKQTENTIHTLINSLPDRCKEIFILSRFEHLKYNEIAVLLNISPKTVENQISNALKLLRKNITICLILTVSILKNIFDYP